MESIFSKRQVLVSLAERGDPFAFYTLCAPHAQEVYCSAREAGIDHEKGLSLVFSVYAKAFRLYQQGSLRGPVDEWIDQKVARLLSKAAAGAAVKPVHEDISNFLSRLQLLFQREYSTIRNNGGSRSAMVRAFSFMHRNPVGRKMTILVLVLIMLTALYFYLRSTGSQVTLSFTSPYIKTLFLFPPGSDGFVTVRSAVPITIKSAPLTIAPMRDSISTQKDPLASEAAKAKRIDPSIAKAAPSTASVPAPAPVRRTKQNFSNASGAKPVAVSEKTISTGETSRSTSSVRRQTAVDTGWESSASVQPATARVAPQSSSDSSLR